MRMNYDTAWKRSINAIRGMKKNAKNNREEATVVAIAVTTVKKNNQISALSNSIDVRFYD